MSDPYLILGLTEDADDATVEAAYLEGIKRFPPERAAPRFKARPTPCSTPRRRSRSVFWTRPLRSAPHAVRSPSCSRPCCGDT